MDQGRDLRVSSASCSILGAPRPGGEVNRSLPRRRHRRHGDSVAMMEKDLKRLLAYSTIEKRRLIVPVCWFFFCGGLALLSLCVCDLWVFFG